MRNGVIKFGILILMFIALLFCGISTVINVIETVSGNEICKLEEDESLDNNESDIKKIALTFDDGPHPYYTLQLLEGLKERDIKVTFFITGANAEAYPEIVKQISDDGHLIGNHTFHHIQLTSTNIKIFKREIISTNQVIKEITGEDTTYIRPPFGSWNKDLEEELCMFPVFWDVDPMDWCSDNVDSIVEKVVTNVQENDIILMHDQYKTSVTAAFKIVDSLTEKGYTFVTVDEILFE